MKRRPLCVVTLPMPTHEQITIYVLIWIIVMQLGA